MKKTLLIWLLALLTGFNSFTQLSFTSENCEGSYTYQFDLGNRESVVWTLESGSADFTQGDHYLAITNATDGTVFKQSNYYEGITDAIIEYYTINLPDNCGTQTPDVTIDLGKNDNTVTCQTESAPITANINGGVIEGVPYEYSWSSPSEGITITNPGAVSTTFTISTPGKKIIQLSVFEMDTYLQMAEVEVESTCTVDPEVTQAHVRNNGLEIDACELLNMPYKHIVETRPAQGEVAEWTLYQGQAAFDYTENGDLTISDVSHETKLVYSISRGNEISRDTLTIGVFSSNGCVSIDQGQNDDIITCNTESAPIYAKVKGNIPEENEYKYVWSSSSNGVEIVNPSNLNPRVTVSTPGKKTINLDLYSNGGNLIGSSEIVFTSDCDIQSVDLCDSIFVDFTNLLPVGDKEWESAAFTLTTTYNSDLGFSYPGFVLFDQEDNAIATDQGSNVFGIWGNYSETRRLGFQETLELPFTGKLKLIEGYFAGEKDTVCSFPFTIDDQGAQEPNTDSIINLLEGEWALKYYSGGFCGNGDCAEVEVEANDLLDVRFYKHSTALDSVGYSYYSGNTLITGYAKVNYTPYTTQFERYGWYMTGFDYEMKDFADAKTYFNVSESNLTIIPDAMIIADAPSKKYERKEPVEIISEDEITIENCSFPYTHNINLPTVETPYKIEYEIESGFVDYRPGLVIDDATDGAILLQKLIYDDAPSTVYLTKYTIHVSECEQTTDPMEGKWLSLHNNSDVTPNIMYLFENGIRYTFYCVEGDCEAQYESLTVEDAEGTENEYTFEDGVLTIDLHFGHVPELPVTFECDSNRITFQNSSWPDLVRLGSNCIVDEEIITEEEISIENCNFPYTHDAPTIALPHMITYELESGFADYTDDYGLVISNITDGAVLVKRLIYDSEPNTVHVTRYSVNVNDCEQTTDPMEGKWLLHYNSGEISQNLMYLFENGLRYTAYCSQADCEAVYESFESDDAIGAGTEYVFEDGVLYIKLQHWLVTEIPGAFECDSNRINFEDPNYIDLIRLGSDCIVDEEPVVNTDSIINILEGDWILKGHYSYWWEGLSPASKNNRSTVVYEKTPNATDSITSKAYVNGELVNTINSKVVYTTFQNKTGWFLEQRADDFSKEYLQLSKANNLLFISNPSLPDGSNPLYVRKPVNELTIDNCAIPYHFEYAAPQLSDSVKWEVEMGYADFIQGDAFLTVNKATDGTIMFKTVYHNGNFTITSYMLHVAGGCVTQAIVGDNTADFDVCQSEHTYQVESNPKENEVANWSVFEGSAEFTFTTNGNLTVFEATDNTVLGYSIANGTDITYDTLSLRVMAITCWFPEVTQANVGREEVELDGCELLQESYKHIVETRPAQGEVAEWSLYQGNATFNYADNGDLTISEVSNDTKLVYSISRGNDITSDTLSIEVFNSNNCNEEKFTLEGHVNADENKWLDGIIYLFDVNEDNAVDSVQFENGIYLFNNVVAGSYTLYAVPYTDNSLAEVTSAYVPTYYVNKTTKEEANFFDVDDNTFGVDLTLLDETTASLASFDNIEFTAYPNPFTDELMINFDQTGVQVSVSTVQGNLIFNGELDQAKKLNTSEWASGVYFVEVKTQNGVKTVTVIK